MEENKKEGFFEGKSFLSFDPVMRAHDKAVFLREALKAVGRSESEVVMQISISFFDGAALILEDIVNDLDEIENDYVKPTEEGFNALAEESEEPGAEG